MIYPVIDISATGAQIKRLRTERNISFRELQDILGFTEPQAIYKWERGGNLPSLDNLITLSVVFKIPLEDILVYK